MFWFFCLSKREERTERAFPLTDEMKLQQVVELAQRKKECRQDAVIVHCIIKKEKQLSKSCFRTASHCINHFIFCTGKATSKWEQGLAMALVLTSWRDECLPGRSVWMLPLCMPPLKSNWPCLPFSWAVPLLLNLQPPSELILILLTTFGGGGRFMPQSTLLECWDLQEGASFERTPEQRTEGRGWQRDLVLTSLSPTLIQFRATKASLRRLFFLLLPVTAITVTGSLSGIFRGAVFLFCFDYLSRTRLP